MTSGALRSELDIDWDEVGRQASGLLSRYIQIDTSNPPGNEGPAARFLADALSAEGIGASAYEPAPNRANLVARLVATHQDAKPVLLLHHMDVVPPSLPAWSVPPFDGLVRDGYVWGRGALDDKGLGTIHLMALVLLKRLGVPLRRDLIFMAVSDEEEGGEHGTQWMVRHHWPEIECEYVWDEGGTGSKGIIGTRPIFAVSVSEKRSLVVRLTARGAGGHGSMASAAPVYRLASALLALQLYPSDLRFNSVTREFFRRVSPARPFPISWMMRHLDHPAIRPLAARRLASIPSVNAMLRDTITPTVLSAGQKANVSPDLAEAQLDVRLLPETDAESFLNSIRLAISDPSISFEATDIPDSVPPSPMDSAMFEAFERAIEAQVPGAIVTPLQTPVATDSRFFRDRGVEAYGLLPAVLTQADINTIHGADERVSIENLTLGIKIALDVLIELCAGK